MTPDESAVAEPQAAADGVAAEAPAADVAAGEMAAGERTIARLADELLPTLIARLGASGLGEIEVRQDGWRVRLRRNLDGLHNGQPPAARASAAERPARKRRGDSGGSGQGSPDDDRQGERRRERGRVAVTSPAVGYYQPRDGIAVGSAVRGGDLLGHIDVLGVRQDVVVPEDGIVAAVSAQPGEAVEYGQLLARLEPETRR